MRVPLFLAEQRVAFETLVHPPAFSAQKRAKFLGVPGEQVAKSVLLAGPHGYVLAVLPATHHLDGALLEHALGGPVRLASAREIAEVFRDCEFGVAVPFGTLYDVPTLLDDSIAPETVMIFEGHAHHETIRMRCADFERLEHPRRVHIACRAHEPARSIAAPSSTQPSRRTDL